MAILELVQNGVTKDFRPSDPRRVTMYLCGPTVYDRPHLGNLRSAVVFDVLYRLLHALYGNGNVVFARNFTDIDDKIMDRAAKERLAIDTITAASIRDYHRETDILNVLRPDYEPRVSDSIPDIIAFIQRLLDVGAAYASEGHVLFDRGARPELFLNDKVRPSALQEQETPARYKRNAADFVLWKPSTDNQAGWDSPWGRGRPGWHIECSAMIRKFLGNTIDIHAGGVDLRFPHHENECAQSHAANGMPLAKYWLHNGMLTKDGSKMSKSLGNIVFLDDLLKYHSAGAVRLFLLSAHYTKPLDITDEALTNAQTVFDKFSDLYHRVVETADKRGVKLRTGNMGSLTNNLSFPQALADLHLWSKGAETFLLGFRDDSHMADDFVWLMQLMGLVYDRPRAQRTPEIEALISQRNDARRRRDFATSDKLRAELLAMGVDVKDEPL